MKHEADSSMKFTRTIGGLALLVLLATFHSQHAAAALGTGFTYQGRLSSGTNVASGSFDLKFSLYDALTSGNQLGISLTNTAVGVTNSYFTVLLDFGNYFDGSGRWLEIEVRTNGPGAFTTLSPRQALTPSPYAVYAANANLLNGQNSTAFAPVTNSGVYVARSGDTMTGSLNLPVDGLQVGTTQFVVSGSYVGMGTMSPAANLHLSHNGPTEIRLGSTLPGAGDWSWGTGWGGVGAYRHLYLYDNAAAATRLVVDWAGNVGIGTALPGFTLDVNGTFNASSISTPGTATASRGLRAGGVSRPFAGVPESLVCLGRLV
jgi:hypothetical protein